MDSQCKLHDVHHHPGSTHAHSNDTSADNDTGADNDTCADTCADDTTDPDPRAYAWAHFGLWCRSSDTTFKSRLFIRFLVRMYWEYLDVGGQRLPRYFSL